MRKSRVRDVYINNLSYSSIFVCGNVGKLQSEFVGNKETYLSVLQECDKNKSDAEPYGKLVLLSPNIEEIVEDDEIEILTDPTESTINMHFIKILSISTGTTFQIGNSGSVDLESRTSEIKRESALKTLE